MNRIYFGKVCLVETPNGKDESGKPAWKKLDHWQSVLWQHHQLFQDAVNYYALALAAMAADLQPDTPKGKAALAWREQVRENWVDGYRKAVRYDGPHKRLAKWLNVDAGITDEHAAFDASANAILRPNGSTPVQRAKALLQLLEEADQSDLNQLCVSRLPWFCTPHGKLDATPKDVAQAQERQMLESIREIHEADVNQIPALAEKLDLGCFVTQAPKERMVAAEARSEAERLFKSAATKVKSLNAITEDFTKHLTKLGDKLALPRLGRKPKGTYPLAVVFKLFPNAETWEAFKLTTASLRKKADKLKDAPVEIVSDFIAEVRTEADQPLFDYFTNRALYREPNNEDRAVWFDFDLAAFIEAIKSPHRYFQDTLTREKAAEEIRKKLAEIEGRGGKSDDEHEEDDEFTSDFGFEGDERINLLRELVTDTLGYVAEAENPSENSQRIEYTIQERTLRGFEEIKAKWRKLAEKGQATPEKLIEVLNEHQTKHRDDFGSATLYRALAQPKYQPIWRDAGTQKWHTSDPLRAWRLYKEHQFELADKERKIRFTPAHAEYSPRYFIIPKQGRLGSDHQPGQLAFTCGIVLQLEKGLEATEVRITYSAPRLRRDALRRDGHEDLESVPWLQPMMQALGLPEIDHQDFSNCRVTLQPTSPTNIQLTFPVEMNTEKLVAGVGKATKWAKQLAGRVENKIFTPMWLPWPNEPWKGKPDQPWWDCINSFSVIATDLGQRDAGAFARLRASCDPSLKRPSRFIGKTGNKEWRATLERSGLFRLPGEDAFVWRAKSRLDENDPEDSGEPFDYREELWGERGRPARNWEADETAELMRLLEAVEKDAEGKEHFTLLPDGWRKDLSFPEQNDKLLIAMRRYQSRISRLHRWCWFIAEKESKRRLRGLREIASEHNMREIWMLARAQTKPHRIAKLRSLLHDLLSIKRQEIPQLLEKIANRILPLRGRSWHWKKHPAATDENLIHQLTQDGPNLDREERPVWLRGQRGLSLERIEQIEELRRRFQSLNQTLRRQIGSKPPTRRDESIPDPCPDLLDKLDNLKEQRVNQTAHMILAEALGLRLAPPPANKKLLRRERDQHGVYEKILDKQGNWIGPADFIVIEDLSRYRATQGRAPRENSRLMKWCHRAVRDKLKQLCEVFGLPVLETPAAYSSRFCARSGVPGFRAEEVAAGFTRTGQWAWLAGKQDENQKPTEEAERLRALDALLGQAQADLEKKWAEEKRPGKCPKRTLLLPASVGPIFVPVVDRVNDADLQPAIVQSDINAAINLALRAIADPKVWSIYPRLRTQRDKKYGSLSAREKRKFGEKNPPKLTVSDGESSITDTTNPNFFADFAGLVDLAGKLNLEWLGKEWTTATLPEDKAAPVPLLHSKSFWGTVKAYQWKRIESINAARLAKWKAKS
jgi:hypothetical protein